jgi:hypothetical protein
MKQASGLKLASFLCVVCVVVRDMNYRARSAQKVLQLNV